MFDRYQLFEGLLQPIDRKSVQKAPRISQNSPKYSQCAVGAGLPEPVLVRVGVRVAEHAGAGVLARPEAVRVHRGDPARSIAGQFLTSSVPKPYWSIHDCTILVFPSEERFIL